MLLELTEVVNTSPVNTVVISGTVLPSDQLANAISFQGPYKFFNSGSLQQFSITPFTADGSQDVDSFKRLRDFHIAPNPCTGVWPDGGNFGNGLYANCDTSYLQLVPRIASESINVLIVPPKGDIVAVAYKIIPYNGLGPGAGLPADDSGTNNFQYPAANFNGPLGAALVTFIATLNTEAWDTSIMLQQFLSNQGSETHPFPGGFTVKAVRSLILPGQETMYGIDNDLPVPAPPIMRYGLLVGDVPILRYQRTYDFSLAERIYTASQHDKIASGYLAAMKGLLNAYFTILGLFAPDPLTGLALYEYGSIFDE